MFTIDTIVDHNVTTAKQAFAYIPNQNVRNGFESLVDAQAAYTKAVFAATTDLGKTVFDAVIASVPKQPTFAKK